MGGQSRENEPLEPQHQRRSKSRDKAVTEPPIFPFTHLAGTRLVVAAVGLVWAWGMAGATEMDDLRQYKACMEMVQKDPEQAFETALSWQSLGGGDAANHCAAAALVGLKQYGEAARRLEALAQGARSDAPMKAALLDQAAQAWLLGDAPDRAKAALTAALKLAPDDVDLLIDRGEALAALADADKALFLNPGHPEGLLERGIIHRLRGDEKDARRDWLAVLAVAPDSAAAESARANLEKMDVKTQ